MQVLEYWIDNGWYVGRLKYIPGVFSQGKSFEELTDNIRAAYHLIVEDTPTPLEIAVETQEFDIGEL